MSFWRKAVGLKEDKTWKSFFLRVLFFLVVSIALSFLIIYIQFGDSLFKSSTQYISFGFLFLEILFITVILTIFFTICSLSWWRALVLLGLFLIGQLVILGPIAANTPDGGGLGFAILFGVEAIFLPSVGLIVWILSLIQSKFSRWKKTIAISMAGIVLLILLVIVMSTCAFGNDTSCVSKKASNVDNVDLCFESSDSTRCFYEFAVRNKDPSVCLHTVNLQQECYLDSTDSLAEFKQSLLETQIIGSNYAIGLGGDIWASDRRIATIFFNCHETSKDPDTILACMLAKEEGMCSKRITGHNAQAICGIKYYLVDGFDNGEDIQDFTSTYPGDIVWDGSGYVEY